MEDYFSREEMDEYLRRKFDTVRTTESGWELRLEGDVNTYSLSVTWQEDTKTVSFRVSPFGFAPVNETCAHNLHRYLLAANARMEGACFAVDSEGRPLLRTRIHMCVMDESLMSGVFETLLMQAERHYLNVLNLARNEHAEVEVPQ